MTTLLPACETPSLGLRLSLPRGSRLGGRTATPSRLPPTPRSRRLVAATAAMTTASDELGKGIAEFYDESSDLWESIWGDHMHHGFYDAGDPATIAGHRAAQIRMVEEALRFAAIPELVTHLKGPRRVIELNSPTFFVASFLQLRAQKAPSTPTSS